MIIGRTRILITLSPSRIDGAVIVGKKVKTAKRVHLRPHEWDEAWIDGLSPYDGALAGLLRSLGVQSGAIADVLYVSPATVSEVRLIAGDRESAPEAARLALLERISGASHDHIVASTALDIETAEPGSSIVLSTSDGDPHAQAVFGWIARAGCRLGLMIPEQALRLGHVASVLAANDQEDRVSCHLGERTTILLCGGNGKLRSIRSIDFGYSLLAEAYARGTRSESEDAAEQSNAPQDSLERLFKYGIPAKSQASAERETLRRVMPLLQPVLQRYCIEIKQTIRFGMPGLEAPPSHILFTGPGAAIPRLCPSIAENSDAYAEIDPDWQTFDPSAIAARGGMEEVFLTGETRPPRIVPSIVAQRSATRRISAGLRTGALCAALALAGEGGMLYAQQRELDAAIRETQPLVEQIREHRTQSERAVEMASSIKRAVNTTNAKLGEQADWFAIVAELATVVSGPVTIEDVRGFQERGESVLSVAGSISINPEAGADGGLPDLLDRFRDSPLFADVQLGTTNLYQTDDGPAKRFVLRAIPHVFAAEELAAGARADGREARR